MHFLSHLPYIASSVPGTSQQQGRDSVHQQKGLSHTQRGFSEPFSSIWRHALCSSADHIPFLPFLHLSLPSFLSLLLHLHGSPGWFFALSRKDILSIWFENFFTSECSWLILLMRLLFSICSHTLEILRFGYVTAKISTLGRFWSAYGFALLTFLF